MGRRWILTVGLLAVACKTAEPAREKAPATREKAPAAVELPMPPGLDEAALDLSVNPCEDFYAFACGGWRKVTPIPEERSRWSRGFDVVSEANATALRDILDQLAQGKPSEGTPYAQALGDFYGACMDEAALEQALPQLQQALARVGVPAAKALPLAIARLHAVGVPAAFAFGPAQDRRDATQVIGEVDQAGLGLPDRDYYLKDDERSKTIREAYVGYVAQMFGLLGQAPAEAKASAAAVMDIETQLARASLARVERREPERLYHRLDRAGLVQAGGGFAWDAYFHELGAPAVQAINATHPPYVEALGRMALAVKPASWSAYLAWHLLRSRVDALPRRFQDAAFAFTSTHFTGARQDLARWKKCVRRTDEALGEALAVPFVARALGQDGKARTLEMVEAVAAAFRRNLDTLKWMDAPTRQQALEKLGKLKNKIGYPDRLRAYDGLQVTRASYLVNRDRAEAFEVARRLAKIGKPVDRDEWLMTPSTVNAYYEAATNDMAFPAGILQPPFFDRGATDAVNYGAIGVIVGHEITHGFDDEGRQYDGDGNLRTWWTEPSNQAFVEKAACVRRQYDGYTAIDDVKLNGALTLGENVADLGGLKLAHAALMGSLERKGARAERNRFTPSQQFFLGFAQAWCTNERPELTRMRAKVDPHSPPAFRVNGPLSNLAAFREAFHCPAGARMVRAEACEVW